MRADTTWFRDAKWGIFLHYLADLSNNMTDGLPVEEWNRQVDAFDVKKFAQQIIALQPGYIMFTLGQNSGYFLSPNATYDSIVSRKVSRLTNRDLMGEIIDQLTPHGIRVFAYLPSHGPAFDRHAIEALKCTPQWDARCWQLFPGSYMTTGEVDERLSEFQCNWESIIAEWSVRWGKKLSGWWFDGCYPADRMYRNDDGPNFASFAAAAKAGNPQSLVAFNTGVFSPIICATEYEDYTAGEVLDSFPVTRTEGTVSALGRYVDGAQYHIITYLGKRWGDPELRFCDEFVIGYSKSVNAHEGVITWDVAIDKDGVIHPDSVRQLGVLSKVLRK